MTTYKRICIKDLTITDEAGSTFSIKRGKEYYTSEVGDAPAIGPDPEAGCVIVFSQYWVAVPVEYFAGEVRCT